MVFFVRCGDDFFDLAEVDVDLWGADVDTVYHDEEYHGEEGEEHECSPFDEAVASVSDEVACYAYIVTEDFVVFAKVAKDVTED